eukprot:Colp12_sorted_trinity150504_noHs@23495
MATHYLEHYLDSVESLPYDLQRNFTLMREVDSRSQEAFRSIEQAQKLLFENAATLKPDERQKYLKQIYANYKSCIELGDHKVSVAVQTYETVDKHIRRLDADLKKFEAEVGEEAAKEEQANLEEKSAVKKLKVSKEKESFSDSSKSTPISKVKPKKPVKAKSEIKKVEKPPKIGVVTPKRTE